MEFAPQQSEQSVGSLPHEWGDRATGAVQIIGPGVAPT